MNLEAYSKVKHDLQPFLTHSGGAPHAKPKFAPARLTSRSAHLVCAERTSRRFPVDDNGAAPNKRK
jgi:hypothetical protein